MERGVGSGMSTEQIVDYVETSGSERRKEERRNKAIWRVVGATGVVGLSLGVISGCNNVGASEVVEHTLDGGEATVKYIDRKFTKQEVIGFTTEVDGASAVEITKRTGPFGIPLPDIEAGMQIDNYVVSSALCFNPGVKKIEETTYADSDKRHYRVEIDPADISVCSKQDLSVQAINKPTGNWIDLINSASNDITRLWGGSNATEAEDIKKSQLLQEAQKMAQYKVNTQCGPAVFDKVKEDMKQLIIDDVVRSDNETAEVIFKVDKSGAVKITGQSELDAQIKEKQAAGWKIDASAVGECKVPASVVGGADERQKNS
jgi:hypothetical protein